MRGKKSNKRRASRTHGKGKGRSHNRGSGNRGGVGMAGTGKKAMCKKPSIWADKDYFGKHSFGMHSATPINCINVSQVQLLVNSMITKGKAKAGTEVELNLTEMGYGKLLGAGVIDSKVKLTVEAASAGAVEKIKAVGGNVVLSE